MVGLGLLSQVHGQSQTKPPTTPKTQPQTPPPVQPQTVLAAGDKQALWIVLPTDEKDELRVYHRLDEDKPGTVRRVQTLQGELAHGGLAAADGTLWLVYVDGTVQTIEAHHQSEKRAWAFESRIRRDLPQALTLKAMTVSHGTPWVLVHLDSAKARKQLDARLKNQLQNEGGQAGDHESRLTPEEQLPINELPLPGTNTDQSTAQKADSSTAQDQAKGRGQAKSDNADNARSADNPDNAAKAHSQRQHTEAPSESGDHSRTKQAESDQGGTDQGTSDQTDQSNRPAASQRQSESASPSKSKSRSDSRSGSDSKSGPPSKSSSESSKPTTAGQQASKNASPNERTAQTDISGDQSHGHDHARDEPSGAGTGGRAANAQGRGRGSAGGADRLLYLKGGRWRQAGLPGDWAGANASVSMLSLDHDPRDGQARPALITQVNAAAQTQAEAQGVGLYRYRPAAKGWVHSQHQIAGHGPIEAVIVDHQIVIGRSAKAKAPTPSGSANQEVQSETSDISKSRGGVSIAISVLRGEESTLIGKLEMTQAKAGQWSLAPLGFDVGLIARQGKGASDSSSSRSSSSAQSKASTKAPNSENAGQAKGQTRAKPNASAKTESQGESSARSKSDDRAEKPSPSTSPRAEPPKSSAERPAPEGEPIGLLLASMDLRGHVRLAPTPLVRQPQPTILDQADYLIMIAVLALATGLMLLFWQRNPRKQRMHLPRGFVLAPLTRRALAGAIDVAPAIIVGLVVFNLSLEQLMLRWPGQPAAASWDQLVPGLTVIGVIIAHTTLGELLTGRSLGKALTGLQVRSLSSRPAKPAQVLGRGLLRLFDLIAWLLLLLPVISPFRQRLGDLVARTVVVMAKPKTDEDTDQSNSNDTRGSSGN